MMPPDHTNYPVGYKKPPEKTRYKKGQSGNPKGRPRGAKNKIPGPNDEKLKDLIMEEAYRHIKVNDGKKQINIPIVQAVLRSVAVNAAKGHLRSQRLFTEMVYRMETERKRVHDAYVDSILEYKAHAEEVIESYEKAGQIPPEFVPHPKDIITNFRNGEIIINGPLSKDEKMRLDKLRERKKIAKETIDELNANLKKGMYKGVEHIVLDDIKFEEKIFAKISEVIRD